MTIKPMCDKCKLELKEFGALLFSPPDKDNKVIKTHLCISCYNQIKKDIK